MAKVHPRHIVAAQVSNTASALRSSATCLLASAILWSCDSSTGPSNLTPADAQFITSDIPLFWQAFDQIKSITDTVVLRRDYLDRGTQGLQDFTGLRWKNATTLTQAVWTRRVYYSSIRSTSLNVQALEPQFRKVYQALDTLIDNPVFPDVYFVIGAMGTGGTTSPHGLLIGTELFSASSGSPTTELTPWQKSVIRPPTILPAIVVHELVHYQQHYQSGTTLLGIAIREGCADFIGEILSGQTINESIRMYGDAHEPTLWNEFKSEMGGTDISRWLYNGGTITETSERPADLGYYIGARICESYFAKAADKHKAIEGILNIGDFEAFLQQSGYSGTSP